MDLNMDITNRLQTRIPRHVWQPVRYFWGNHASDWPQTGHFIEFQSILIWWKVDLRDLPGRWCQPWGSTISTCCMPFRCVCSPLRSVGCGAQTRPYMRGFAAAAPFRVSEKGLLRMSSVHGWLIDTAFYPELRKTRTHSGFHLLGWCLQNTCQNDEFAFPDQLCSPVDYWTFRICITKRRQDQVAVPWRSRPATITTMMLWNSDASIGNIRTIIAEHTLWSSSQWTCTSSRWFSINTHGITWGCSSKDRKSFPLMFHS